MLYIYERIKQIFTWTPRFLDYVIGSEHIPPKLMIDLAPLGPVQ